MPETRRICHRLGGTRSPRHVIAECAAIMSVLALSGCASDGSSSRIATSRTVHVQEFSRPDESAASAPADMHGGSSPTTSVAASTAPANPDPVPVASDTDTARPVMPGDENVVESVIGQVSGRPIFADELLAPIADQLRQEAERLNDDQFIARAREIISNRLSEVILNELFLAEAEASLTEQQQMGLLAFLKDLQEKNIAERGGTIFGATKRIAEEEEMSLQEFQQAQKDKALIQNLLYERIAPRVIVSWRDVQREYELRKSEFNPTATVTLQMLRLSIADQKDAINSVQTRLNAGASFDSVVQELSLGEFVAPAGGGDGRFTLPGGSLGEVEIAEVYKPALAKIQAQAGATTEAIESRGEMRWLHIKDIEQPPPLSLFDVQEQLYGELQARRFNEERNKYINSLLQRGIYDEHEEMSRRVLAVALLRYSR